MAEYGLLGQHLDHSYSKLVHEAFGLYEYDLWPTEPEDLDEFFKGNWKGCNVTIPYKKEVLKYCKLAPKAERIGSANTIAREPDGTLKAHNTDYHGFRHMAEEAGISFEGKKVLILGSGGAGVMCKAVVEDYGGTPIIISRSGENNYDNLDRHYDAQIIVNATPVGMFPNVEEAPLNLRHFTKLEALLDLIYNPAKTEMMFQAERLGAKAVGGLSMLVWQAARAAEIFTGRETDPEQVRAVLRKIEAQTKNIVLIGMPGCGKTVIGQALAEELGREFADTDQFIEVLTGSSIPDFIREHGEESFRIYESSLAFELGQQSGIVVSTGGGIVKEPANFESLKRNSIVVYINRPMDMLATEGRPLSSSKEAVAKLYMERFALYNQFADFKIDNIGSIEDAVKAIREAAGL